MGGLGNGRRGGRSPPLMIGALIACILVLGFNYWVSSSRNLELQTKLYDLEGQVRRGAAERGVAELKKTEFQEQIQGQKEQIQRQKEQIGSIEELYKRQLEEARSTCGKDKGTMQLNISTSTKTMQQLKGQLSQRNGELGKLQKQLQDCQGNLNTLNKKLTYDMTQCNTQILSQKEFCDERVAAARLEVQKKLEKLKAAPMSSQVNEGVAPTEKAEKAGKQADEGKPGLDETKKTPVLNHNPVQAQANTKEPLELLTNDIIVNKGPESESIPQVAAGPLETLPPLEGAVTPQQEGTAALKLQNSNLTEDQAVEVMDVKDDEIQIEEADPGVEDMLIDQEKAEVAMGQKVTEPGDYDAEEQMPGQVDLEKAQSQRMENTADKDMEEEVADYNGDEDNEGEFEADKQAELAQG
ncbi:unnamed protein product [Merluccius merluccius]